MIRLSGGRFARLAIAAAIVMAGLAVMPARADVVVQIDKSSQRMAVSVDGVMRYDWPVSTGRSGFGTPSGVYHPQLMARRWFSRKYYNSPMPHAIFFYGGFAIHGTYELSRLGGPA
jgi:lipoprotein-anchoring transpeptidase ErfK/SrfK